MPSLFKIFSMLCVFCVLIGFISCKEEETSPQLTNQILLGDSIKTIKNARIKDYRKIILLGNVMEYDSNKATHWNYDVTFTDGKFVEREASSTYTIENASFIVTIGLLSVGTDEFHHGNFIHLESNSDKYIKENIDESFFGGTYYYDYNGDGAVNVDGDDSFTINGGTVKTSGKEADFTIDFNLKLYEDQYLKGNFSGDYLYKKYF